jgi:hypothetical protein
MDVQSLLKQVDKQLPSGALLKGAVVKAALGISAAELQRLAKSGDLTRVRLSPGKTGSVRYTRASVLDLVERWAEQEIALVEAGR